VGGKARRRPAAGSLAAVAAAGDSTATLRTLRDRLAAQLDAYLVPHQADCACSCGVQPAAAHTAVTALSRALADVLARLDRQVPPGPGPVEAPVEQPSNVDEIAQRRERRRAEATDR
jgi:hypothetical protein